MKKNKQPSFFLSLIPIIFLVGLLFLAYQEFGSSVSSGANQIVLLLATAISSFLAILFCKTPWKEIEKTICQNIFNVSSALLMLLLIGSLSGIWMISGVIPTMIYYGIECLNANFFLCSCCIICAFVSVMIGSSWTTIATMGVALMAIGKILGFSEGWIAGAIISGAYFGDKISPLSDTTVLASSITNTPLFSHIRYMQYTTVPTMFITLFLYLIFGYSHSTASIDSITCFTTSLKETFILSPWLLFVPLSTIFLIIKKVPTLIILFISILTASAFALCLQSDLLLETAKVFGGEPSIYKGLISVLYGDTHIETNNNMLNELISTGGMAGMLNTVWLTICAMCFGGAMQATGMLKSISVSILKFIKSDISLVSSTIFSGILLNIITAEQYISIILTGNMFKDLYKEKRLESKLLSRTIEDSVTISSVLIPWNACGMAQAAILGVATLTYMPFCLFNLFNPLISIIVIVIECKIRDKKNRLRVHL